MILDMRMARHGRKTGRALAAMTLAVALGGTAQAQAPAPRTNPAPAESRVIVLEYEVHIIGLRTITIDTITRIDGGRYMLDLSLRNEGILRALSAPFESRNQAAGLLTPKGVAPSVGYTGMAVGKFRRSWVVRYLPDGSLDETHTNFDQPENFRPSAEQKKGSYDPATALVVAGFTPGLSACNRTIKMFDSKRRFDLIAGPSTRQVLPEGFTTLFAGETETCELRMVKIAGYGGDGNPKDQATDDQPIRVWLGKLDDSGRGYPVRVTLSTGWGTLVGRLKKREFRAMTPEDRAAMGR